MSKNAPALFFRTGADVILVTRSDPELMSTVLQHGGLGVHRLRFAQFRVHVLVEPGSALACIERGTIWQLAHHSLGGFFPTKESQKDDGFSVFPRMIAKICGKHDRNTTACRMVAENARRLALNNPRDGRNV